MDGVRQVLVDANVLPPDARCVGVKALPRGRTMNHADALTAACVLLDLHQAGCTLADAVLFGEPPAPQMVAAGNDPRLDALRNPHRVHKVANFRFHAH